MRFARRLTSHLTPEWRKHYVRYDELKKKVYDIVNVTTHIEDNDYAASSVNTILQDEFFTDIALQLEMVVSFFKAQEAKVSDTLRGLQLEIDIYERLKSNAKSRNARTTIKKKQNLKLLLSEYYLNLSLLQNFQQLNHTGFRKILKKHDKIAVSSRGKTFFKSCVCESYFWKSPELLRLIDVTEGLMIDKLENGNRSKAMNALRVPPLESKDVRSHWYTLRAGWLMGVIFVSVIVLILGAIFRPSDSWNHVTPTLRGLRIGLFLTIWFYCFAINTYEWRRAGVNSVLIFQFNPRDYLNFVQLFEVVIATYVLYNYILFYTGSFCDGCGLPNWRILHCVLLLVGYA